MKNPKLFEMPEPVSDDIAATVEEFVELKRRLEEIDARMHALKPIIKARLELEGGKMEAAGYPLALIECSREIPDMEGLKEKFGKAIKPFLKEIHYTQIRVGRKL